VPNIGITNPAALAPDIHNSVLVESRVTIDVGDADGADQQRHSSEVHEKVVERTRRVSLGDQRGCGLAHLDLAQVLWVGGGGEHALHGVDLVGAGPEPDGGGVAIEADWSARCSCKACGHTWDATWTEP
jgi:hypothetical protein